jgi:hypothetical protein
MRPMSSVELSLLRDLVSSFCVLYRDFSKPKSKADSAEVLSEACEFRQIEDLVDLRVRFVDVRDFGLNMLPRKVFLRSVVGTAVTVGLQKSRKLSRSLDLRRDVIAMEREVLL